MVSMGRVIAVRQRVALWALTVLSACLAAGSAGLGSAHTAYAAAPAAGCKPQVGGDVTLRLKAPTQTVRATVGETIKVIVNVKHARMGVPEPRNHQEAVCRISWHRVSASKVIARFRAQRAARTITFVSTGMTSHKGCPPDSHGCPHPVAITGYAKIDS